MRKKFFAILSLTRWKEHIPFVVPLTVLGSLLSLAHGGTLDLRIVFVTMGNIFVVSYAFMVNDIEDADDDKKDPFSKKRNPISSGKISKDDGYRLLWITAVISILFFLAAGIYALFTGVMTLVLSHLYSWRKVRLKALPLVDLISHVLMLSTLLLVAGYAAYSTRFTFIWPVVTAVTLISAYGQIYNQLRDLDSDRKAGLMNTTILLGEKRAAMLKNAFIALAVLSIGTAIYSGYFPTWLIIPAIGGVPLVLALKTQTDMRGSVAIDSSGTLQLRLMLLINIIIGSWLFSEVVGRVFML